MSDWKEFLVIEQREGVLWIVVFYETHPQIRG